MRGGFPIKNIANAITVSRIGFAALMLCAVPFSTIFWVWYLLGGLSDLIDGIIARGLKHQSVLGAKLDSIADLIFLLAIVFVVITNITLPGWFLLFVGSIALVKFSSYGIGYLKYHTFSALHTYMNKLMGLLLFTAPVLLVLWSSIFVMLILCILAILAAIEEFIIILRARAFNPDCRSILSSYRS